MCEEMESKENVSANTFTEITINKVSKVVHCSDGIIEELVEEKVTEVDSHPRSEETVDPKSMSWGPWFSHYAWKSGTKVLNAVDYAGESLASFFGITTPKYQIEIDEYERIKEEKRKIEEDSAGWVAKDTGGDIPLVLNEPGKVASNQPKAEV